MPEVSGGWICRNIASVSTNHAANTGVVETFIHGGGYLAGATAILRMSGQQDISGSSPYVDPGGSNLSASFDLTSAANGSWDVIVSNPDLTTETLAGASPWKRRKSRSCGPA